MKFYTYYRRGIGKWRTEVPKDPQRPAMGLRHLSLGLTKEEAERKALARLEQIVDVGELMSRWLRK